MGGNVCMASVLVIEDEPNIAMVLELALEDEGHQVTVAPDGLLGIKMLQRIPKPDIIFLDLHLPYVDGREILEIIYCSPDLKQIPVIVITGSFMDYLDLPEDHYTELFEKPFDLFRVISVVNTLTAKNYGLREDKSRISAKL
jgi:CheY-like chemotaxis protein